jgi:ribosomal protein L37E
MNPLLENAVLSVQLGLEDYASADTRRVISAARNLYAGVLLLCKEVLRRLSPSGSNDILIRTKKKAMKEPDGSVRLVGDGKRTIDRAEIEETFKQLQLNADLSKLRRLAEIRNDIEHMHASVGPALIQEAIADAMPIIRAVVVNELHEELASLLGSEAWEALLNEARVFKEEQDACRASFDNIDWKSEALEDAASELRCPCCTSTLLRNDNAAAVSFDQLHLVCSKCGEHVESDDVFEEALGRALEGDVYEAAKEGFEAPLTNCPECDRDTFVVSEARCVNCGFSLEGYECAICDKRLSLDDYRYGGSLCSYHQYVVSKDD